MPLYGYQCDHCQTAFEVRASFQEKDLGLKPVCPNCQSAETHQVLTVSLYVHKGNGDAASRLSPNCGPNAGSGCCG